MKRWFIFLYGIGSYLIFLGVFFYAVLFIGNLLISNSLDGEPNVGFWQALLIDIGLLTVFALQHSGMARPAFKRWVTCMIPEPIERSTYVLISNVAMILLFAFWEPLGGVIWSVENQFGAAIVYGAYFAGWALLLVSTFAICHFDLFGLRQVWFFFNNQPYEPHEFRIPMLYSVVRHPLYVGWLMIFWAAPVMSLSHMLFAAVTTVYILVAIQLEENDLISSFGQRYTDYRRRVPMLIPGLIGRKLQDDTLTNGQTPVSVFHEQFESRA